MVRIGQVARWGAVAAFLFGVMLACQHEADIPLAAFLAINGSLSLAGAWALISRRSSWSAYWAPRMISEFGHWVFDVLWIAIFAALGLLITPFLGPALIPAPFFVATVLLVRRLKESRYFAPESLRFWV